VRVLFLHQNFPGQFLHVATALKREGRHELLAVVPETNARPPLIPTRTYRFDAAAVRAGEPLAQHYAERAARGAAVAQTLDALRRDGFTPDLVVGHGGWGETLFVRDVWPRSPVLLHAEFFYAAEGADAGFDRELSGPAPDRFALQVRARNAAMALALLDADRGVAPTRWQASRFPESLRAKIALAHEGVDTDHVRPSPGAEVRLGRAGGVVLRPGDEVLTFVSRDLEPHRGYHVLMRALPAILARRPRARAVIVGGDGASYSPRPASGRSWKTVFLAEVANRLDRDRVHFVGRIPYPTLLQLLQVSAAHVYLTYPFVLSWSMLEAMSAGALVIGSRTPPVEEVIEDGRNGVLRDFFDVDGIADAVVDALARPARYRALRDAGRQTIVDRYDLKRVCLPAWRRLLGEVAGSRAAQPDAPTVGAEAPVACTEAAVTFGERADAEVH
jgi:glycosyltransferase involved in cell wall biosynthesis